ncbi:amino acid transporter [Aspergillus heterothallicus]
MGKTSEEDIISTRSNEQSLDPLTQIDTIDKEGKVNDPDKSRLRAQGHEAQLERSFTLLGASALAYSISNSWLTYATCFGLVLTQGKSVTALLSLIIAGVLQWVVFLGLGKLCSAFPSSGGPYHFAFVFATERTRNFAAYTTGSGLMYTAISTFGYATYWFPDFGQEPYQVYLVYLGIIFLSLIPIYLTPQRYLNNLTKAAMGLSLLGMVLTITITICLGMGRGHCAPGSILTEYKNTSGWNRGTSWLLSIATALYCYSANGAVMHIAVELPDPGRKLPQILNMAMAMGLGIALPWIVAMLFCIEDMAAVQSAFFPSLEVFGQITGSKAVATSLQAYMTFLYYTCIPGQWITCSRLAWAFHGLPFPTYWQHIDSRLGIPWRITVMAAAFRTVYGILYIASTAAYNSIINAACLMLNVAYVIPQGILLILGRWWGYALNVYSVIFLVVVGVLFCLPSSDPADVRSMNYNATVVVGLFGLICLSWMERRCKSKSGNWLGDARYRQLSC